MRDRQISPPCCSRCAHPLGAVCPNCDRAPDLRAEVQRLTADLADANVERERLKHDKLELQEYIVACVDAAGFDKNILLAVAMKRLTADRDALVERMVAACKSEMDESSDSSWNDACEACIAAIRAIVAQAAKGEKADG